MRVTLIAIVFMGADMGLQELQCTRFTRVDWPSRDTSVNDAGRAPANHDLFAALDVDLLLRSACCQTSPFSNVRMNSPAGRRST